MVKIGPASYNMDTVSGIKESEFIKRFECHYLNIGKGRKEKMKADYKKLKKHFIKKVE